MGWIFEILTMKALANFMSTIYTQIFGSNVFAYEQK